MFRMQVQTQLTVSTETEYGQYVDYFTGLAPSFAVEEGKIYRSDQDKYYDYGYGASDKYGDAVSRSATLSATYTNSFKESNSLLRNYGDEIFAESAGAASSDYRYWYEAYVSMSLVNDVTETLIKDHYGQFSLFFADDREAHDAAAKLAEAGYVAVPSDTTYQMNAYEALEALLINVITLGLWLIAILFLAFFIYLCTSRTLGAFKSEMAVMRSMGISVKVIRISMYARMLLSLIPAYLFLAVAAFLIYTSPVTNAYFVFLHAGHYVLIVFGMLLLTLSVTQRQLRKLFKESVKKSLKGGATV